MTYQNHSDDNAVADESSSLFLPSGDAKPKKKSGVSIRAMIATSIFLLGTLAMIYYGGSGGSSNTHRTDGTSEVLLLGHNQAGLEVYEPYYDPSQNYCFSEQYGFGRYCWYPTEGYSYPTGTWKAVTDRGFDSCGPVCPAPVYDPRQDYCFLNTDTIGKYCWYWRDDLKIPYGNWIKEGAHNYNDCGPECPAPPTTSMYDPNQDYCFTDTDNAGKYCWYPTNYLPVGNWQGVTPRGYDQCGPSCITVLPDKNDDDATVDRYDPIQDFCFHDNDNVDKYCWYIYDETPEGNWKGEGGHGYDNCGPKCTKVKWTPMG